MEDERGLYEDALVLTHLEIFIVPAADHGGSEFEQRVEWALADVRRVRQVDLGQYWHVGVTSSAEV